MDLKKIGSFIAELRKEQNLSQEAMGEKIGVTNKTISRWETGTYLPPADMLLVMSELFHVSINEILSGKRLTDSEYRKAAESNLAQTIKTSAFSIKDKIEFYKKKWLKEHIAIMVTIGAVFLIVLVTGIVLKKVWLVPIDIIMLLAAYVWVNNTMMSYVEKNTYDGLDN